MYIVARIKKINKPRVGKTQGLGQVFKIKPGVWVIDVLFSLNLGMYFKNIGLTQNAVFIKLCLKSFMIQACMFIVYYILLLKDF